MTGRLTSLSLLLAAIVIVHAAVVQPWLMRWGATDREVAAEWPGDDLSAGAGTVTTRAVTIHAPAEKVWPWIVQLGQDRAGWYSYRLLENIVGCRMPRVHRVVPELQHRDVGDKVWMYPANRLNGIGHSVVARVEPRRALVLATMSMGNSSVTSDASQSFLLDPIDVSSTRLIMRGRGPIPESLAWRLFDSALFQPIHFAMERRMMLTIKALSEGEDPDEMPDIMQAVLWIVLGLTCAVALAGSVLFAAWRRPLLAFAAGLAALAVAMLTQPPVLVTALLAIAVAAIAGPVPHRGAVHNVA